MTQERWFDDEQLRQMARPTMDRAIEALDAGDIETARALCNAMKHEWRFLHDAMAELILGLVTFVQRRFGEDQVGEAWSESLSRGWRRDTAEISQRDRRDVVDGLAATWRAHSTSGKGPHPGAFTIEEDDEKFIFRMNPCGSGQRMWLRGFYQGPDAYGVTLEAHDWSYGRKDFPLYCTHCTFMNESLPIKWYGAPLYPSSPPTDYNTDPCVWYWYKDPADIPEEFWERYGLLKPDAAHRQGS